MPPSIRLIRAHVIRRRVARQPDRYLLQLGNCGQTPAIDADMACRKAGRPRLSCRQGRARNR